MERKVLIVTTIASMIKYFCMPLIDLLQKMGYEVQVACNFVDGNNISEEEIADFKKELTEKNVVFYQIPFSRKITDPKNYQCYKQLKSIVKEQKFSFIHCHTPIASLIASTWFPFLQRCSKEKLGITVSSRVVCVIYDGYPNYNQPRRLHACKESYACKTYDVYTWCRHRFK